MSEYQPEVIRRELKSLARFNQERIDDVPLGELGIDSLDFFEFIIRMDEAHGIQLHHIKLSPHLTLKALLDAVIS